MLLPSPANACMPLEAPYLDKARTIPARNRCKALCSCPQHINDHCRYIACTSLTFIHFSRGICILVRLHTSWSVASRGSTRAWCAAFGNLSVISMQSSARTISGYVLRCLRRAGLFVREAMPAEWQGLCMSEQAKLTPPTGLAT